MPIQRRRGVYAVGEREWVIGVVGLGYVGLAYALGFSMHGFRVRGVDIDDERVKSIENGLVNGFSREALLKVIKKRLSKGVNELRGSRRR
jgi:UDP-N-acetyl-D-glucosamine dehydrogenase